MSTTPTTPSTPTAAPHPGPRRQLGLETAIVLGVSLGASAIWSILALIDKLTRHVVLSQQTTAMNTSVTPDRPWLDLSYQLVGIALALVPVSLACYLLATVCRPVPRATATIPAYLGLDARRPAHDLAWGLGLAAAIGIPGLGLYLGARALGLNTTIAAANLSGAWWTIPVLVLAAVQNALIEEVVMVGYLFTRWAQIGWRPWHIIIGSALIRGTYHLYQGFGGAVGNVVMGVVLGLVYRRTKRVAPLVIAHAVLDIVSFVGYALLRDHLGWLTG